MLRETTRLTALAVGAIERAVLEVRGLDRIGAAHYLGVAQGYATDLYTALGGRLPDYEGCECHGDTPGWPSIKGGEALAPVGTALYWLGRVERALRAGNDDLAVKRLLEAKYHLKKTGLSGIAEDWGVPKFHEGEEDA